MRSVGRQIVDGAVRKSRHSLPRGPSFAARMNAISMPNMTHTSSAAVRLPVSLRCMGLCAMLALTVCGAAHAEKADRDKPLNFAADSARVDDARHLNILSGNVEMTKGTMVFRAARVEVHQNPDGTQTAHAVGGSGGRAFFRQKREGLDEYVEGEGEVVDYDGRADTVTFSGRAVMRRLRGATLADEVVGQTVVYDNKTEVFQVMGGARSANSTGRVRGVISPKPATSDSKEGGR